MYEKVLRPESASCHTPHPTNLFENLCKTQVNQQHKSDCCVSGVGCICSGGDSVDGGCGSGRRNSVSCGGSGGGNDSGGDGGVGGDRGIGGCVGGNRCGDYDGNDGGGTVVRTARFRPCHGDDIASLSTGHVFRY